MITLKTHKVDTISSILKKFSDSGHLQMININLKMINIKTRQAIRNQKFLELKSLLRRKETFEANVSLPLRQ